MVGIGRQARTWCQGQKSKALVIDTVIGSEAKREKQSPVLMTKSKIGFRAWSGGGDSVALAVREEELHESQKPGKPDKSCTWPPQVSPTWRLSAPRATKLFWSSAAIWWLA